MAWRLQTLVLCSLVLASLWTSTSAELALNPSVKNIVCPDNKSQCEGENTCCVNSGGSYSCCPLPRAVCCSDHSHCCPGGYKCGDGNKCERSDHTLSMLELLARPLQDVQNVICPDSKSECPDGQTCCVSQSGSYACCNAPMAVCCDDKIHCCPHEFKCAPNTSTCEKDDDHTQQHPLLELGSPPPVKNVQIHICPDSKHYCSTEQTCCRNSATEFGCCDYPNADCCQDNQHCCPSNMKCDVSKGGCVPPTKFSVKSRHIENPVAAVEARDRSGSMVCPDGTSVCNDGYTCCKRGDNYSCCPIFNAVCCSDEVHCCPSGFQCDGEYCVSQLHPLLSLIAAPTIRMEGSPKDVL